MASPTPSRRRWRAYSLCRCVQGRNAAWRPSCRCQRKARLGEQRADRRGSRREIAHVAAERTEAAAHVGLIDLARQHHADRGEALQLVAPAKRFGRRVIGDKVARRDPPQRCSLAVPDLHDAELDAPPHVLGARDRDPVLARGTADRDIGIGQTAPSFGGPSYARSRRACRMFPSFRAARWATQRRPSTSASISSSSNISGGNRKPGRST